MLLTIMTTHQPATDLGYLLHKNPARRQTVAARRGYQVHLVAMGEEVEGVGGPSQMAVFGRLE